MGNSFSWVFTEHLLFAETGTDSLDVRVAVDEIQISIICSAYPHKG